MSLSFSLSNTLGGLGASGAVGTTEAVLAIKVGADNDANGNPRRGWFVWSRSTGNYLGFVEEGYSGYGSLRRLFPNARETYPVTRKGAGAIPIGPGYFRELRASKLGGG